MVNFSATRVRLKTLSTKLFNNDFLSVNLSRNSILNYHKMHLKIATIKELLPLKRCQNTVFSISTETMRL